MDEYDFIHWRRSLEEREALLRDISRYPRFSNTLVSFVFFRQKPPLRFLFLITCPVKKLQNCKTRHSITTSLYRRVCEFSLIQIFIWLKWNVPGEHSATITFFFHALHCQLVVSVDVYQTISYPSIHRLTPPLKFFASRQ